MSNYFENEENIAYTSWTLNVCFFNRNLCEIEFLNFPWAIRPNFRYLDPDPMRIWILSSKIHANRYYTVDHEKPNRTKGNNTKKNYSRQFKELPTTHLSWCGVVISSCNQNDYMSKKRTYEIFCHYQLIWNHNQLSKLPITCYESLKLYWINSTVQYLLYDKEINLIVSITKLRSLMEYRTVCTL